MQKVRKVPMRMCVGCHEMMPKRELLRVVKPKEGDVTFDPIGKLAGRGAYVCPNPDCFKKARKQKSLERALETAIEPLVFDQLEARLEALCKTS